MLSLEESREKILASLRPPPVEEARLSDALSRFAAEKVRSSVDLPPADNSAMDGYAVRAADVAKASRETPVTLRLSGQAPAGAVFSGAVQPGTCVRVFTGSVLPRGADAVVMQEDTQAQGNDIQILDKASPWENCRLRGEDVKQNATLIEPGVKLTAARLTLLAAAGIASVRVGRRPLAGLIATGNELREPGQPLEPAAIYESNRTGLAALAVQAGAIPKIYPLVPDDLPATKAALQQAFDECDVVITTGGVSVGEMDWVRTAFVELGGQLDFWQVAIRPGKPFAFGQWQGKVLFALPGNPVSAAVTFFLLVQPALLRLQGANDVLPATHPVTLAEPLVNHGDRRHFMRVTVNTEGQARPAGVQASHILSAMAEANGLIDVPAKTTLPAGASVPVLRWD